MPKFRLFVLSLLALCVLAGAAPARPEVTRYAITAEQADAALHQDWYGVYLRSKKCGFMRDAFQRVTEKGQTFYRTHKQAQLKVLSLGQKGEIRLEQTFDFAGQAPFILLRGEELLGDGRSTKLTRLAARDQGYEATITVGNVTRKQMLRGVDFTLADALAPVVWLKKGPASGEKATFRDFSFDKLQMVTFAQKLQGTKEIVHDGAKISVNIVEQIDSGGADSVSQYDSDARMVSGSLIGLFEIRRESEPSARKTEFGDDLLDATTVKLDRPVGKLRTVTGLTLRGKGKVYGIIPDTALQTVHREGDETYLIKIGKQHGKKVKATEQQIRDSLAETPTLPTKDARVVALARKAVAGARTDQEKVRRLCKFVHEYIKYEVVYLPKVEDILERKVGDCKSYALLFACLARAAGVPARVASGYVYMNDDVRGFGGHDWNEVVVDGRWVPVDATLGLTELLPFYICLDGGSGSEGNMTRTVGQLSFELVDVQRGS
jgi:hypothetical protein